MRPVLAVLAAALCFATTGTAQELADVAGTAFEVGLARIVLGGALLAAGSWWLVGARSSGGTDPVDPMVARTSVLASWPRPLVVVVGAIGVLAYQPTFFQGTASNGVAVGTVVALGSAPVITGALDGVLRRRLPGLRWGAATALALVGVALVSGALGQVGVGSGVALGADVLWSVAAGASYAVYTVAAKELLDSGWSPRRCMGAMFGVAAALAIGPLALSAPRWLLSGSGLLLVLWLGVVTTAIAYLLFGWGLARLPAASVATLTLAEPLGAALLGVLLLGERLDSSALTGLVVLVVGLVLLAAGGPRGPSGTARVVFMCGPSGSGKSTYAARLEAQGWHRMSIDLALWQRGTGPMQASPELLAEVECELQEDLRARVAAGERIVLDFAFPTRAMRDRYRSLLEPWGVVPETIYLDTDPEVVLRRVRERRGRHADDVVLSEEQASRHLSDFERPGPDEGPLTVVSITGDA